MTGAAFLLFALTVVAAVGDWIAVWARNRPLEYLCKPATLVLLTGVALALDPQDETVRACFVVALLFCLAGDVVLMLPLDLFVFGLASFLLGHVAYVVGMLVDGVHPVGLLVGVLLAACVLGTVGIHIVGAARVQDPSLLGPVLAYMAVISTMVACAFGTGRAAAITGALLFYASDSLIAWTRFVTQTDRARAAIMVTYHLGQFGLVVSLL